MPATDRVTMRHPSLPDAEPVDVSRQQLEEVYAPLGWEEATDTDTGTEAKSADPADGAAQEQTADAAVPASGSRRKTPTTADPSASADAEPDTKKGN